MNKDECVGMGEWYWGEKSELFWKGTYHCYTFWTTNPVWDAMASRLL